MKKSLSKKLTLGRRSVAILSDGEMSAVQGGYYSQSCGVWTGCQTQQYTCGPIGPTVNNATCPGVTGC